MKIKNLKYSILSLLFIVGVSCEDEEKFNYDYDLNEGVDTGFYLRTGVIESGGFDFLNLDTSAFIVNVEAVFDTEQDDLSSIDVFASFIDNSADNGDNSADEVLITTVSSDIFTPSERGYLDGRIAVDGPDIISAFGLVNDDLLPGDVFVIRLSANLADGSTFSVDNNGSDFTNSFYNSPFVYRASVGCPLGDTFVGDYEVTLVQGVGAFGRFTDSVFNTSITAITDTQRSIPINYLADAGPFGQTLSFEFICTDVTVPDTETGVGCGGTPTITWGQGAVVPALFDIDDDTSFTLSFTDFIQNGGCGAPSYPVELLFTKL